MVKIFVSLDDTLLRHIDRMAQSRGRSRSAYLAELAERDAARSGGPGATPDARRALERLDEVFAQSPPGESTAFVRAEREAR
jgi:hypothetical protein